MSADETTFNKSKDLYNNALAESGFKHKITFQQQKMTPKIAPKIEKEAYGLTYHTVIMFQQILVKNSSAYWVNISEKRISFINSLMVIMSGLVIVLFQQPNTAQK